MLVLSMKSNRFSRHMLEMRRVTLKIEAVVSLLLTTTPEIKILLTSAELPYNSTQVTF